MLSNDEWLLNEALLGFLWVDGEAVGKNSQATDQTDK
jgi:hypothetical protein